MVSASDVDDKGTLFTTGENVHKVDPGQPLTA